MRQLKSKFNIMCVVIFTYIISISFVFGRVYLTEVMYNPIGSDNNKEFVEVYGTNNLTGFIIGDTNQNDSLICLQFNNSCNVSLIVEEGFNYSSLSCSIYSAGATIGNGLSNSGDTVYLYSLINNTIVLVDNITYNPYQEGHSFTRFNFSFWNNSEQSPCNVSDFLVFENYNQTYNETYNSSSDNSSQNINYSSNCSDINLSDNCTNTSFNNTNINYSINNTANNITGNTTNNGSFNSTNQTNICNVSIDLILNSSKLIFYPGEKISFYNTLSNASTYYEIEYWIRDYFNHSLKSKKVTKNLNKKYWTVKNNPNTKITLAYIENSIRYINCTNINNKTKSSQHFIIINDYAVQNNQCESNSCDCNQESHEHSYSRSINYIDLPSASSINVTNINYDSENLLLDVTVYKGSTNKKLLLYSIICNTEILKQEKYYMMTKNSKLRLKLNNKISCCNNLSVKFEGVGINYTKKINVTCENKDVFSTTLNRVNKSKIIVFNLTDKLKNESRNFVTGNISGFNKKNNRFIFVVGGVSAILLFFVIARLK